MEMEITNEIFEWYLNVESDSDEVLIKSEELGFEIPADFEEAIYIWAVNHGDKAKVMKLYDMSENDYAENRELWAGKA
jgi:hypothetical protein